MPQKPRYNQNREYENLVNEIRIEMGLTLKQLGRLIGVCPSLMWFISQGYTGPFRNKKGKLKQWAEKLQAVFQCDLSEIFPREICNIKTSQLTNDQLCEIAHGRLYNQTIESPHTWLRNVFAHEAISKVLTDRQRTVLKLRYEKECCLETIGPLIGGVKKERVRQIEAKSLRLIRQYVGRKMIAAKREGLI